MILFHTVMAPYYMKIKQTMYENVVYNGILFSSKEKLKISGKWIELKILYEVTQTHKDKFYPSKSRTLKIVIYCDH